MTVAEAESELEKAGFKNHPHDCTPAVLASGDVGTVDSTLPPNGESWPTDQTVRMYIVSESC